MRHHVLALVALFALIAGPLYAQRNMLSLPDVSGVAGSEMVIPLSASLRDHISGVTATIFFDPTVIRITDVQLASATTQFTLQTHLSDGKLRIAMAAASPLTTSATLLNISVRLIGAPGTASIVDLAQVSMDEGARTVGARDGMVRVLQQFKIMGSVYFHDRVRPVPGVQLTAAGPGAQTSSATDSIGGYLIDGLVPGQYTLTPSKGDGDGGAIDAMDVADILRFLVGSVELSAAQRLSADVSGNGRVGTTDAALILRYLVGLETSFPAGSLWQFTPPGASISLVEDRLQNFTCYLLGDVDGDWGTALPAAKRVSHGEPRLDLALLPAADPARTSVAVVGRQLRAVLGGVLELRYDAAALSVTRVQAMGLATGSMVVANSKTPGILRIAFAGADPVDGDGALIRLDLLPRGAHATPWIDITAATLNARPLAARSLGSLRLGVQATCVTATQVVVPTSTGLDPNFPNPFNSSTVIGYRLAGKADRLVRISVYSLTGQRVRQLVREPQAPGLHRVTWDGRSDHGSSVASGVYLVRLEAGGQVDMLSVMYLK